MSRSSATDAGSCPDGCQVTIAVAAMTASAATTAVRRTGVELAVREEMEQGMTVSPWKCWNRRR